MDNNINNIALSPPKKRVRRHFSVEEKTSIMNTFKVYKDKHPEQTKSKLVEFTATSVGIGASSVYNILKEHHNNPEFNPPKKYHRSRSVLDNVTDKHKHSIRGIIHSFFLRNEPPTVEKVLAEVNMNDDLPNFKNSTMRALLKEINFQFKGRAQNKSCTSSSSPKDTADTSSNGEEMWTSEDIISLISLVQIHSTIYDPSDTDYSNTEIVNTIWQQIGIKLKRTSESCSNKWRELQSEYQKRSNNLKYNRNHKNKDWVYLDSLDFLKQYLQDTLYKESSSANNLNPFLYVSSDSQSSEVIQNVSTGDIFNESSSSASTDSVSIKSEIEVEDNFVEIQNHSGNDISNEMESDSKLNQDLDNTIDNDYSLNEMQSDFATNDLNLETNVDGTKKSMKLFLLSLLEDASHLSKPAQRAFKLNTLALLHNLQ